MRLLYCRTHFINNPNLSNKWKLLLLALVGALMLGIIFLQVTSNPRRPATILIYNNGSLCHSNTHLANSHNHWTMTSSSNENTQTSIVIVIPSRRKNFSARNLIRQTYGSIRDINNIRILAVVFMLGGADETNPPRTDSSKLEAEKVLFGDIIMGDFVDSYRNLSRKTIMAYDWLTSHCHEADFVVKTDDDVVVDIFKLTDEMSKWPQTLTQSSNFWCAIHKHEEVIRDNINMSMYYVSPAEYANKNFPTHCAGLGYVTSMKMIHRIIKEISESFRLGPICTHEDAFLTGIVPEKINSVENELIKHIDKTNDWILYVDKDNLKKDGRYVWRTIEQPANATVDYDEFRRRTRLQVFYLLQQGDNFEKQFMRLWYLMENSFRNWKKTIKIENN